MDVNTRTIRGPVVDLIRNVVGYVRDENNQDRLTEKFGDFNREDFCKNLLTVHGRTFGTCIKRKMSVDASTDYLIGKYVGVDTSGGVAATNLAEELGLV